MRPMVDTIVTIIATAVLSVWMFAVAVVARGGVGPAATGRVAALDITPADVSIANGQQAAFRFLRGETTTEADRDAMQHAQLHYLLEIVRHVEGAKTTDGKPRFPGCSSAIGDARDTRVVIGTRLGFVDYESKTCVDAVELLPSQKAGAEGFTRCEWLVDEGGRHYGQAFYGLRSLQQCLTASKLAADCASVVPAHLLPALSIEVRAGKCTKADPIVDPIPLEHNADRAKLGGLSTRAIIPALNAADRALLHATHEAHAAVTRFHCGGGPVPTPGAVSAAHTAYENACGDDATCRHFRQLKKFDGYMDPQWSQLDACTLRAMQDDAHERWMRAQEMPEPSAQPPYQRWVRSRAADDLHLKAHWCANYKDLRPGCDTSTSRASGCALVRPPCPGPLNRCQVVSCQSWLAAYRATHPQPVPTQRPM